MKTKFFLALAIALAMGFSVSQVWARGGGHGGGGHHGGGHHGGAHHAGGPASHHSSHHHTGYHHHTGSHFHHAHWGNHNRPFSRDWYAHHGGRWGYGWGGWGWGNPWAVAGFGAAAAWLGLDAAEPIYGNYGDAPTVYTSDDASAGDDSDDAANGEQDNVEPQQAAGQPQSEAENPAQQAAAAELVKSGASDPAQDAKFLPLGVFTLAPRNTAEATAMVQLAVSKDGVLRGSYYDLLSNQNYPVRGAVNKKTQQAAFTFGPQGKVVFDTSLANLTQDTGAVAVHYENGRTANWTLARYEKEPTDEAGDATGPAAGGARQPVETLEENGR